MRVTSQFLRSRAKGALQSAEYLDLSDANIDILERLHACSKLKTLVLRNNHIRSVENLDQLTQLWHVDLSNNQVQDLSGFSRFLALGILNLCNNDLNWNDLAKIRHMHILDLSLHGNKTLEKDPYYRIHVIDSLPNIWMLDGRIVTSAERLQVQQFFNDLSVTDHPVRRKLSKNQFVPTCLKKVSVDGVFGDRAAHLMRKFPVKESLNIDTDKRRLRYLAYNLQEDLFLEKKCTKRDFRIIENNHTFLEDLLTLRQRDRERCNMLLLLLVASLEFAIPTALMQETLEATQLIVIGKVYTMDIFLLPRDKRCLVVSLLLSAVKVDRDIGQDGGFYDRLYLSVYYSVSELMKLAHAHALSNKDDLKRKVYFTMGKYQNSKSQIASEVVQLLCVVPGFFDYITKDVGVMNLVSNAVSDYHIIGRIKKLIKKLDREGVELQVVYEQVSEYLLKAVQQAMINLTMRGNHAEREGTFALKTHKSLPQRPQSTPVFRAEFHASGRSSPDKRPVRIKSGRPPQNKWSLTAKLGEEILLGPQTLGRIISMPDPDIALVQMDVVPAESGAMVSNSRNSEEHYAYIDLKQLQWDGDAGFWRPRGTTGDRITVIQGGEPAGKPHTSSQPSPRGSPPMSPTHEPSMSHGVGAPSQEVRIYTAQATVSAQLKEKLNLRLELGSEKADSQVAPSSTDLSEKTLTARSDNEYTRSRLQDSGEPLPDGIYTSVRKAMLDISALPGNNLSLQALPSSNGTVTANPEQLMQADLLEESQADAMEVIGSKTGSRRSSLASQEEVELCLLQESRPATASPLHKQPRHSRLSADRTIQIPLPQKDVDPQEPPPPTPVDISLAAQPETRHQHPKPQPSAAGPVSSATHQQRATRLSREPSPSPVNDSELETPRTSSQASKGRAKSARRQVSSARARTVVHMKRGDSWLAGGRDVYWEGQRSRPQSGHTPGWKEGLPQRPKSAVAFRTLRRAKTPTIMTPSSMAYDSSQGFALYQSMPDIPTPNERGVSPSPHYTGFRSFGQWKSLSTYRPSGPRGQPMVPPHPACTDPANPVCEMCFNYYMAKIKKYAEEENDIFL